MEEYKVKFHEMKHTLFSNNTKTPEPDTGKVQEQIATMQKDFEARMAAKDKEMEALRAQNQADFQ